MRRIVALDSCQGTIRKQLKKEKKKDLTFDETRNIRVDEVRHRNQNGSPLSVH
jgi:hypothetical protein